MHRRLLTAFLAGTVLAWPVNVAIGQELSPELQAFDAQVPGSLINDPTDLVWLTQGTGLEAEGVQDESIPGGGAARRYSVAAKGADVWEAQTLIPLLAEIKRGEVVTVGFYARTVASGAADGQGTIGVRVQENAAPYSGFADQVVSVGSEWKWYEVSGTAASPIKRANATVAFQLAGAKQVIEIGQAIVVKGAASIISAPPAPKAAAPVATVTAAVVPDAASIEMPDPLRSAGRLINNPAARPWGHSGAGGRWEELDEPAIWLGKATRFTTTSVGANPWDLGTNIPIATAIAEGDRLVIAVVARTQSAQTADGKGLVAVRLQGTAPPYDGFGDKAFTVGDRWQMVRIPVTATRSFGPGEAAVALHFATAVQSVDIGPAYVFKAE